MSLYAAKYARKTLLGDEKPCTTNKYFRVNYFICSTTDSTDATNERLIGQDIYYSKSLFYLVNRIGFLLNIRPGTELFSRRATPKVSSPQQRFTTEFGMESEWFHCATSTRKAIGLIHNPEDCIVTLCTKCVRSSPRSISTPWLHPLLDFHLAPMNRCSTCDLTGLFHESTHLEVGFPLRCFQRLSAPHLATQYTSGASLPVLSY